MKTMKSSVSALAFLSVLGLAACDSGGDDTGSVSVGVTDAPVDGATNVWVEFTGVTLKHKHEGKGEISFDFTTPRVIDLLALQGDASETDFGQSIGSRRGIQLDQARCQCLGRG